MNNSKEKVTSITNPATTSPTTAEQSSIPAGQSPAPTMQDPNTVKQSPTATVQDPMKPDRGMLLRITSDKEAQTITLVLNCAPEYKVVTQKGQVFIDLPGVTSESDQDSLPNLNNPVISAVRYIQHADDLYPDYTHTTQVVLDLAKGCTYKKNVSVWQDEIAGTITVSTVLPETARISILPVPIMRLPTDDDYEYIENAIKNIASIIAVIKKQCQFSSDDIVKLFHFTGGKSDVSRIQKPDMYGRYIKIMNVYYMRRWGIDIDALFDGNIPKEKMYPDLVNYQIYTKSIEIANDSSIVNILKKYREELFRYNQAEIHLLMERIRAVFMKIMSDEGYSLNDFAEGLSFYADSSDEGSSSEDSSSEEEKEDSSVNTTDTPKGKRGKRGKSNKVDNFKNMIVRLMKNTEDNGLLPSADLLIILKRAYPSQINVNHLLDGGNPPQFCFPLELKSYIAKLWENLLSQMYNKSGN